MSWPTRPTIKEFTEMNDKQLDDFTKEANRMGDQMVSFITQLAEKAEPYWTNVVKPGVPDDTHEDLTWDSGFCKPEQIIHLGLQGGVQLHMPLLSWDTPFGAHLGGMPVEFNEDPIDDVSGALMSALQRRLAPRSHFDDSDGDTLVISNKLEYLPGGPSADYCPDGAIERYTGSLEMDINAHVAKQLKKILLAQPGRPTLQLAVRKALKTIKFEYPDVVTECQPDVRWVQDMKGNRNTTKASMRSATKAKLARKGKI